MSTTQLPPAPDAQPKVTQVTSAGSPTPETRQAARDLIAAARSKGDERLFAGSAIAAGTLSLLTGIASWLSFPPVDYCWLAWLAPVPLLLLTLSPVRPRRLYLAIYPGALVMWLAQTQWLRLGDPTMYFAWIALSIYLAAYGPLFVACTRVLIHRWHVPLVVAAPTIWVGLDYFRSWFISGFSWYQLGHTQYRWLELIQVSDLVGCYGVTAVMIMSACAIALLFPTVWLKRLRLFETASTDQPAEAPPSGKPQPAVSKHSQVPPAVRLLPVFPWKQIVAALVAFGATLGYGVVRRHQAEFTPGPRVGLVQGNFVASLRQQTYTDKQLIETHMRLTGLAVRQQPDLIVWPESMYRFGLLHADPQLSLAERERIMPVVPPEAWDDPSRSKILAGESARAGAALIVGTERADLRADGLRRYNSAVFVRPEMGVSSIYDKQHLVPFGEYIPFRDLLPFLSAVTPYRQDMGLEAGNTPVTFQYHGWKFAPVICFEDTVPELVRQAARTAPTHVSAADPVGVKTSDKPVDVLVNLSNDGWFHGSSGLDQHLITSVFRAVECRTPLVRAVNTGISAIVDGDGAIVEPEVFIDGDAKRVKLARKSPRDPQTGRWHRQLNAAIVSTVPLDHRRSLYLWWGDWFGAIALAVVVATTVPPGWLTRLTTTKSAEALPIPA